MKALADKDALEESIRHEADPKGVYSRNTIDTAGLVKWIRKRHRDSIEEHQRDRNAMRMEGEDLQLRLDDEKERLHCIIRGQKEAMRLSDQQGQQVCDDYRKLRVKYGELLEDNKAKDTRATGLKEKVEAITETCKSLTKDSMEALKSAGRKMEHRIARIVTKHQQELAELRGWNVTLQERLKIARRLQPVIIFHRAQVGTVCEMHEKLVQMKQAKKEELAAKDKECEDLRTHNDRQEREIRDLKTVAKADREVLNKTAQLLSDTRKTLSEAESKMGSHRREVNSLNQCGKAWERAYRAKDEELVALKSEMNILKADQRMELIRAQAKNEGLQTSIDFLQAANEKMDEQLESWENGLSGSLRVSVQKHDDTQPENEAKILAKELKAANARADVLQISVNALKAENGVLETQLKNAANTHDPQIQEQVERLRSENRNLGVAAGEADRQKQQLTAQFTKIRENLEEQFANRTRELEVGFNQGFENLRELRNQWFLHKRGLEEHHNRQMVAEDLRCEIERQRREDQLMVALRKKEGELRGIEDNLHSREAELATQRQHREDQLMATLRKKEGELRRIEDNLHSREAGLATQVRNLEGSAQEIFKMKARAEEAEKEVIKLQVAAVNMGNHRDSIERNLGNEIENQRRDGQRHLDLINEETSKMEEGSRLSDLHMELQIANCSINCSKYHVTQVGETNESLSQRLYGADFSESDVRLLQDGGRPVLLAQLQAAKRTLESLRSLLATSPNVEVGMALSIITSPRGDEDAALIIEDIFGESDETQQRPPQPNLRKRSGAPLGSPTYGEHENNATVDDWGDHDQKVSTGARLSTPEEILQRQRSLPKSRRTRVPAKSVPRENIDPAIRDQ